MTSIDFEGAEEMIDQLSVGISRSIPVLFEDICCSADNLILENSLRTDLMR